MWRCSADWLEKLSEVIMIYAKLKDVVVQEVVQEVVHEVIQEAKLWGDYWNTEVDNMGSTYTSQDVAIELDKHLKLYI